VHMHTYFLHFGCCFVQTKTTTQEADVEEEDKVLRCVQELKSELASLRQDKAPTADQSDGDLQSQLTKFEDKLEAQSSAMTQLQQQMLRIEQLCMKLNNDLNTLATKQ